MASLPGVASTLPYNPVGSKEFAASQIHALSVERTFREHREGVTGIAILDQNRFISGSIDKTIKIWEKSSDKSLNTRQVDDKSRIWKMQLLSDKVCLAIGWSPADPTNRAVRIYNSVNGQNHDLLGRQKNVSSLAAHKNGLLASGSDDGSVNIWDPFSSKHVHTYFHGLMVFCVGFSPDGKTVVCGTQMRDQTHQIQMWEITQEKPDDRPPDKIFHSPCRVGSILVMKDGRIVTGSVDGMVRVWDPSASSDKAIPKEMKGHFGNVTSLAERPDNLIVSGSSDKKIILWNVDTGESWPSTQQHTEEIHAIAAFDDNSILTASLDGTIKLWV